MKVSIDRKAGTFTITGNINTNPEISSSGKTKLVISDRAKLPGKDGFDGKDLTVQVNAYIVNEAAPVAAATA